MLDPATAVRVDGQPEVRPTAYVSDTLLVRTRADQGVGRDLLASVAAEAGLQLEEDPDSEGERNLLDSIDLRDEHRALLDEAWVERVRLVPAERLERATAPVDAWEILQSYRMASARLETGYVGLEHLVSATAGIGGTPYTIPHGATGNPYTIPHGTSGNPYPIPHSGNGVASYAFPGTGGRQPVTWLGPPPQPKHEAKPGGPRRPVVAVLDTGVCTHEWFDADHVVTEPEVLGVPLGIPPSVPDSELTGSRDTLVGGIEPDVGHGTFITGLIRQRCPDATVLAVRVFHGDGVVAEGDLLATLRRLCLRQLVALSPNTPYQVVDVVSLSLGYYHEQPEDPAFDPLLMAPLSLLGRLGVTVVVSAGNDATSRPMYPAAFASYPGGPPRAAHGEVPILAVGALNPDRTIAMFSNDGPWVRYLRPGAALVSTYPSTINTSMNPIASQRHHGAWRASIDPDDFSSGFATWSGTSFSAPVLAGDIAAALLEQFDAGADGASVEDAVERATKVIADLASGAPENAVGP
ncbi:MAG: S8/S53 family peptidase [Actinomycetales bacterium]|nr:S8/S53 family peptidase [Actinomycetales bacterium]